jgi:hypothetical protein
LAPVEPGFALKVLAQRGGVFLGELGWKRDFNSHESLLLFQLPSASRLRVDLQRTAK